MKENINRVELYYSIINIVDYLALADIDRNDASELYRILDKLLRIEADRMGEDVNDTFKSIADANDAGEARSWQGMVAIFKHLHETGERR